MVVGRGFLSYWDPVTFQVLFVLNFGRVLEAYESPVDFLSRCVDVWFDEKNGWKGRRIQDLVEHATFK